MKKLIRTLTKGIAILMLMTGIFGITALADDSDNSLADLGIENAQVSPEFKYGITEYDVTVPAGTKELQLNPQTTDSNAKIEPIQGTELQDGKATVTITVTAVDGGQATYTLHVKEEGAETNQTESTAKQAAAVAQSNTTAQTNPPQTSAPDNIAKKQAELINTQTKDLNSANDKISLLTKILYGMVALVVTLLFVIINMILRNKDLKKDLKDMEYQLGNSADEFARKERTLESDYYYAPVQQMQPDSVNAPGASVETVQEITKEAFGNAAVQMKAGDIPQVRTEPPVNREVPQPKVTNTNINANANINAGAMKKENQPISQQQPFMNEEEEASQTISTPQQASPTQSMDVPQQDGFTGMSPEQPSESEQEKQDVEVTMIDL